MAKQKTKAQHAQTAKTDSATFTIVLTYCMLIIFAPIVTFFVSKNLVFDLLDFSSIKSNIFSAVSAVIALHVALGAYLYRAYFDSPAETAVKED